VDPLSAEYLNDVLTRSGVLGPARVREVSVEDRRQTILSEIVRLQLVYDRTTENAPQRLVLVEQLRAHHDGRRRSRLPRAPFGLSRKMTVILGMSAQAPSRNRRRICDDRAYARPSAPGRDFSRDCSDPAHHRSRHHTGNTSAFG
jgi:hypothetical protein